MRESAYFRLEHLRQFEIGTYELCKFDSIIIDTVKGVCIESEFGKINTRDETRDKTQNSL